MATARLARPPARPTEADLCEVLARELALSSPGVRRDDERVRSLLHPGFLDQGASGQAWDGTSVPVVISGTDAPVQAGEVRTRYLGADAVLVTCRSRRPGREALRNLVWLRAAGAGWLRLFHQGTVCAAP